uniref:START domain-containing protein n=1 Tax=Scylla olivacea TaxID=85551 RepID=A0A0P4WBR8_SCYOL
MSLAGHRSPLVGGPGSLNTVSADIWIANQLPGMQINGRMSAVRRFFCLFVTFDFLFTGLFWAICVLIKEGGKYSALVEEIIHYNIRSSIFDIVMVAAVRFTLLLLLYALLHINHWWMVAITTAGSCAFFISKSLMYEWQGKDASSYPFEVTLLLLSFLISWIEAWFVDFRVLPQENRAKSVLEAASNCDHQETDPLLPGLDRVRDYLSAYSETVGDFYSPMESPLASDDEEEYGGHTVNRRMTSQERELQISGVEALQKAWETIHSPGWKLEKESSHGDTIYTKLGSSGTKIYKLTGVIDTDSNTLFNEIVHNIENMPSWNKAVTVGRIIQSVDSSTDVVYQVAAEGPGKVVTARDFVNVRHWKKIGNSMVCANISVVHKDEPPQKNIVRGENGPCCWVFQPAENAPRKCFFQWLLDTDLKGWIPQYVLEQALTYAMTDFMSCLRNYAPTLKTQTSQRKGHR